MRAAERTIESLASASAIFGAVTGAVGHMNLALAGFIAATTLFGIEKGLVWVRGAK